MHDVWPTILFFLTKVGLWGVKLESIIGLCNLRFCYVRYYIPKCMPRVVVHDDVYVKCEYWICKI
jgi:hypothetical protein